MTQGLVRSLCAAALISAFFLGGCGSSIALPVNNAPEAVQTPAAPAVTATPAPSGAAVPLSAAPTPKPKLGGGTVAYTEAFREENEPLSGAQEDLMLALMDRYYLSLAYLEAQDPAALFTADAQEQAVSNRIIWEVQTGIRSMQRSDLSLTAYSFVLTVQRISEEENGDLSVRANEDFVQNFTAYPQVDSRGFNVRHTFVMRETEDGWRLVRHRQSDSLNNSLIGRWHEETEGLTEERLEERRDALLTEAKANADGRASQSPRSDILSFDNRYDRTAAVAYARQWVGRRNPKWASYDGMGGNCQNFVSQSLHAGGVPMDYRAPAQWKWYGDRPSSSYSASGRAPAWTGVGSFLDYAENNTGYGLVASVDAAFYTGEAGDVIHLGTEDNLRHTVLVTQAMKNSDRATIDYLIASNTADLLDFPVSAFYYQEQVLIRIGGWND